MLMTSRSICRKLHVENTKDSKYEPFIQKPYETFGVPALSLKVFRETRTMHRNGGDNSFPYFAKNLKSLLFLKNKIDRKVRRLKNTKFNSLRAHYYASRVL